MSKEKGNLRDITISVSVQYRCDTTVMLQECFGLLGGQGITYKLPSLARMISAFWSFTLYRELGPDWKQEDRIAATLSNYPNLLKLLLGPAL